MAYVYEINGQRVEFEKEPTDADIDEAARQLGPAPAPATSTFGEEVRGIGQILAVPAAGALNYALENPLTSAAGAAAAASYVPGVNKLPIIRDVRNARLAAQNVLQQMAQGGGARPPVPTPTAPVAPPPTVTPPAPTTSPILDAQGRPMVRTPPATGPVAPAPTTGPMPPGATAGSAPLRPPAQPGVMDRASQIVRQLAANRAVQGAARIGGGFIGGLVTPGNIGQDYPFPTTGPLRGSEINPNTGRPWTKEELAAYRAQYGR